MVLLKNLGRKIFNSFFFYVGNSHFLKLLGGMFIFNCRSRPTQCLLRKRKTKGPILNLIRENKLAGYSGFKLKSGHMQKIHQMQPKRKTNMKI